MQDVAMTDATHTLSASPPSAYPFFDLTQAPVPWTDEFVKPVELPEPQLYRPDVLVMTRAERRRAWEADLQQYGVEDPETGIWLPTGTEVMFRSEAKEYYKLSEKELRSLPYQVLPSTPSDEDNDAAGAKRKRERTIVPLNDILALVARRCSVIGVEYPQNPPLFTMLCTGKGDVYPSGRTTFYYYATNQVLS